MKSKKTYPYPSYKNPIRLSLRAKEAQKQLKSLATRIMANEEIFQRKGDKIPALPFGLKHYIAFIITLDVLNVLSSFMKH